MKRYQVKDYLCMTLCLMIQENCFLMKCTLNRF